MRLLVALLLLCWLASAASPLVCIGAKVYPSPTDSPIDNAVLIVENGKIVELAAQNLHKPKFPASATQLDCAGKIVVAGFWNSHVHFENGWDNAAATPAANLRTHIEQMLTRWGFTTVWDLGSLPTNTFAIRHRIETGEVSGPYIHMAGDIFPKNGHPIYLPPTLQLPEAATPEEATRMAQQYLQMGLDGIKLFTGAFMGDKPVINMDTTIVKAAVDIAHGQGKPVFAHPQNHTGVENALAGGVDVLAHTLPAADGFTAEELATMKRQHTALIPTLTLWTTVADNPNTTKLLIAVAVSELSSFFKQGNPVLFGTDVGFIDKYNTAQEFEFMGRALGWRDILASLTTNPATFFKAQNPAVLRQGAPADLVILDADPVDDVKNFSRVAYTIRAGQVIYHSAR